MLAVSSTWNTFPPFLLRTLNLNVLQHGSHYTAVVCSPSHKVGFQGQELCHIHYRIQRFGIMSGNQQVSINGEITVKILSVHNESNFWKPFWLEWAGIPKKMVPPPGRESKMLSKEGEVVGTAYVRAQFNLAVTFRGLETQIAAHTSTAQVHCGKYKCPRDQCLTSRLLAQAAVTEGINS